MIRCVTVLLLFSFSSYAADDSKSIAASNHLQVLEQCLLTAQKAHHNDYLGHEALYRRFSTWYTKNRGNQKRVCIDRGQASRAFQQFLHSKKTVCAFKKHRRNTY